MAIDVLLVNTPWAEYHRPSMQLGLIQALLKRGGINCRTLNTTLKFAETVGPSLYRQAEDFHRPHCEWVFSAAAFNLPSTSKHMLLNRLRGQGADQELIGSLRYLRSVVKPFVESSVDSILRIKPSIVGFTTAMLQTTASAAIATELKRRSPSTKIVFGGAHCEGGTGYALMQALPCIDVAVTQQCDAWIDELFSSILRQESLLEQPGIIWRSDNAPVVNKAAAIFDALDSNPVPDFADYFEQLENSSLNGSFERSVPFEGSRGCWWGERRHCRFCGLNGTTMKYRHRSAQAVVDELAHHQSSYQANTFIAVDEIIPKSYFSELPALIDQQLPSTSLFYEMSPSVSRSQLKSLADVCQFHSQPGIEHLSDRVLGLMGKGVKAINNVVLLRRAQELNVMLLWNLIFGIPGEKLEDYNGILTSYDSLVHLMPPNLIPLTLARHSPYHTSQSDFGLRQTGAQQDLDLAYPVANPLLLDLAMNFEYEILEGSDERIQPLLQNVIESWTAEYKAGARLLVELSGDTVYVEEGRCTPRRYALSTVASLLYRLLERPRTAAGLARVFRQKHPALYISCGGLRTVQRLLEDMLEQRILWFNDKYYVAIAIPCHENFWLDAVQKPNLQTIPVITAASAS